jgi:hypothetical protein
MNYLEIRPGETYAYGEVDKSKGSLRRVHERTTG